MKMSQKDYKSDVKLNIYVNSTDSFHEPVLLKILAPILVIPIVVTRYANQVVAGHHLRYTTVIELYLC